MTLPKWVLAGDFCRRAANSFWEQMIRPRYALRILYGSRITLLIGAVAVGISMTMGMLIGMLPLSAEVGSKQS